MPKPISTGTTDRNQAGSSTKTRSAPISPPIKAAGTIRLRSLAAPTISARYPRVPVMLPGIRPMLLDIFAVIGGRPTMSRVGKVTNVPEPTIVLIVPAATPASTTASASSQDTPRCYLAGCLVNAGCSAQVVGRPSAGGLACSASSRACASAVAGSSSVASSKAVAMVDSGS